MQDAIRLAQDFLLRSQLPNGGWGYSIDTQQAYPEPTCYSMLALKNTAFSPSSSLIWLSNLVNSEGRLLLPNDNMPNWASSLLVTTLIKLDQLPDVQKKSVDWLLEWKSQTGETSIALLDGSLIGWSWISDTFSWVQPTSHAVLALKLAGLKDHARVKEAEKLLYDRMCLQGGWNFGNPVVFGQPIDPSAVDTAIALFALQDLEASTGRVDIGIDILEQTTTNFPSTLSLALCILCMDIFNRPVTGYVDSLLARQGEDGSWGQKTWWTALSALALQAVDGGENVFKI